MSSEEDNIIASLFDNETETSSDTTSSCEDSSSEDEELHRRKIAKATNFVERIVPEFDDILFQSHFRLTRTTYRYLLHNIISAKILPTHSYGRVKVFSEKALLLTLWYLANQETYRQISDRFDVAQSAVLNCIKKIIKYLVSVSPKYIKLPVNEEAIAITEGFKAKNGIKNVIGAIDGTHINIKKPKDQVAYCNRKGDHSVVLQGVCDDKKRFINVYCGEAGSVHDARILKRSNLYRKLMQENDLPYDTFLLGDSAYPNLSWLVVPYKDNGHLSANQKTFNYRHSSTRIIIENAFGLLKGRFRRLKFFENVNITFVVEAIVAACVLHNICISLDDLEVEEFYNEVPNLPFEEANIYVENENICRRTRVFNEMFHI